MATNSPLILDKPEDWPNWIDDIQGLIPQTIWKLIDPDAEAHDKILEEPHLPEVKDVNVTKTLYPELSATERTAFDQMFKFYQAALERYKRQEKGLQDARTLIKTRISNAKSILLKGSETPREWLATLKKATKVSEGFISQQIANRYQETIRKSPTTTSIGLWLASWEKVMAEGIKHDIPDVTAGKWLRDLAAVMRPLSEALYVKFINGSTNDAKNKPERYLEVSAKIREIIRSDTSKKRVTRGTAFAAEFDGEPASEEDEVTQRSNKLGNRKRAGTGSALQNAPKGKRNRLGQCKACGQRTHDLSRCFYAFPELRFDGFVPNERLERKVQRALMDNSELKEEIEAIGNEIKVEKIG